MTKKQADAEARKRLGKGARFRIVRCPGQMVIAGRKATRGCYGPGHQQPCPGGPDIYCLERPVDSVLGRMMVGEARGSSYEDTLARYDAQRAEMAERLRASK